MNHSDRREDRPGAWWQDSDQRQRLERAVGQDHAAQAIRWVRHRLDEGSEIRSAWGYTRSIADCYRGQCRNKGHGELHGPQLKDYHRGTLADREQEHRAREAQQRPPVSATESVDALDALDALDAIRQAANKEKTP